MEFKNSAGNVTDCSSSTIEFTEVYVTAGLDLDSVLVVELETRVDLDLDLAFSDSESDLSLSLDDDLDQDLCHFLWYFWLGVNLPIKEPPCLLRGILDLDLPRSTFFANFKQHQSFGRVCPSAVFWPQIVRIETSISV